MGSEEAPGTLVVPLDQIRPNQSQPRRTFDPASLEELRDSIQNHGVLQPIVVRRVSMGYEIIAGERRWRSARLAGLHEIPAVVREDVSDEQMLELALVENVQRQDLDALEKARGYKNMMEGLRLTQEDVAQKVGLRRATVANHLRLLELQEEAQKALSEGLITMGHARALLGLRGGEGTADLLKRIVREGLSVRDTENAVRLAVSPPSESTSRPSVSPSRSDEEPTLELQPAAPWIVELQRRMQIHLGTRVSLANREGYKGRIVIDYYTREDLDRLVDVLAPREDV